MRKAEDFLNMTQNLKDVVYERTAHLHNAESVISADIYYHANCLRTYELKFKRIQQSQQQAIPTDDCFDSIQSNDEVHENSNMNFANNTLNLTKQYIESIQYIISGEAFELSSLTNAIKNKYNFEDSFNNRFVKNALIEYFGEDFCF